MVGSRRTRWMLQAGLLLLSWPAAAQLHLGETSTNMNGTVSSGYAADFGNMTNSDHGLTVGGVTNLSGSFHNPNFLSYNGTVYLNQSRADSNFQSISNASGFSINTNIFNGSRFPGSISYSRSYDSEGSYDIPGITNFVTHGNNDALNVSWTESLARIPTVTASYLMGNSNYTVYGTNNEGNNHFHSLNLHSSYNIDGFNMGAFYTLGGSHALVPEVAASVPNLITQTESSSLGFNVSHPLPLRGETSTSFTRSSWTTDFLNAHSNGTIDLVNSVASVHPKDRLSFSLSANYSDNLSGQLEESVLATGVVVPILNSNESSDSLDLLAVGSYTPIPNLQTSVEVERRSQLFLGETYGVTSYGGAATYAHTVPTGSFNASVSAMGNTDDKTGDNSLSFSTTENYTGIVLGWHVNGLFSYSQNVQTLLVSYMNSYYSFSGNVRHKWGRFNLSAGAGGSRTGITDQPGTESNSQSYNVGMGYGTLFTANGNYSKSSGEALATGAGLVTVTVPPPTLPSDLITLYGGEGESASVSSAPVHGLTLTASWARSRSNTTTEGTPSSNTNDQFNTFIQYQVRKLSFNSGYSRLSQDFGGTGTNPQTLSTFYIGVSRWFSFF